MRVVVPARGEPVVLAPVRVEGIICSEIVLEKVLGPPHAKLVCSFKIQAHKAWVFFLDKGHKELFESVLLTVI